MKRVEVEATVVEKGNPRQVQSRFKEETYNVADAVVQDESGTIKLTLWNEQIDQVNVGDRIKIENGYVTSFKGEVKFTLKPLAHRPASSRMGRTHRAFSSLLRSRRLVYWMNWLMWLSTSWG